MVLFIAGALLGSLATLIVVCCCIAGGRADRNETKGADQP